MLMQKKSWFLACLFLTGYCLQAGAQKNYFMYIQADDKQQFSISVNNKLYNSSASGYVIVPKLIDGKYEAKVHFPGDKYPEQKFFILVDKKDLGYALKNFNEKGWGLFNLQSLVITMNGEDVAGTDVASKQQDITSGGVSNSAFGNMLSQVTNDSTLTKTVQPPVAEVKPAVQESEKSVVIENTAKDTALDVNNIIASNNAIVNGDSKPATDTVSAIFIEKTMPADTMIQTNIVVENQSTTQPQVDAVKSDVAQPNVQEAVTTDSVAVKKEIDNPFFKKEETNPVVSTENSITTTEAVEIKKEETVINGVTPAYRQDCRSMIDDGDFEKMKRKMVMADNNDGMVVVAKKYLNNKCLTEEQVKTLSGLFLSDEGRYMLFDAMYSYVYDYGNFPLLEKQLVDEYYKTRFKAMLH